MKRRYAGVVSACHPNGTYDIEYDNGMKDTDVDVELLHKNGSDSDDNVKQKKFKEGDKVEIHFQSNFEIQGNWKLLQPVAWPRKLRYVVFQHGRKKSHLYPGGSIGQAPSQDALLSRGFTQAGSGRNDNFGCGDLFCGQGD
ncbi:hypothetical protein PC116_g53 [Phytophthora cactorum]|nr:hypothetical protein Pcac1_g11008 [Phytophthora cactorum]KAG2936396.1 hypothetical protein PC114_g269 [Phytophthora cactorum]KAG3040953.1 hypothetical protein PC119_g1025 [Phytophthora cactorum]KAG3193466.1 hypothetical protein C6341_g55 [Phytophthora cactorum]KAG3206454.1 hypothetical protein PC128_g739 [Phytophthora cactorum]